MNPVYKLHEACWFTQSTPLYLQLARCYGQLIALVISIVLLQVLSLHYVDPVAGIQHRPPEVVVTYLHASDVNPTYPLQLVYWITHDEPLNLHVLIWSKHF